MSRWKMTRNIAVSDKLQIPSSKLQRITKLQGQKPACAPLAPASAFGFWGLRSGTSLAFGVWCLVFRPAAVLFGPDVVAHSLQTPEGYARRSRLVWAKNPSPQTWSYLWNGVLSAPESVIALARQARPNHAHPSQSVV